MNAFTQAHTMTKEIIQAGDNYAATFALCLKHIKGSIMTEAQKLAAQFIADAKARIVELEAFKSTNPSGYVVITGEDVKMSLQFDAGSVKVCRIESATRYSERRIADAIASQVRNGANYKAKSIWLIDQIVNDIECQQDLIRQCESI